MCELIGVKLRRNRVKYVHSGGVQYKCDENVIVEFNGMMYCGEVKKANFQSESKSIPPENKVIRRATSEDLARIKRKYNREVEAQRLFKAKAKKLGLDMKLIDEEISFDEDKIIFYFTADGRIDFRKLVKELAAQLHMRIELRQVGVRDEARKLGGLSLCGQPFCCSRFMENFNPVSIKMAKDQGLSLSPNKISGMCGRLMCCLKHEQDSYEELVKRVPKLGTIVNTPRGTGKIVDRNLLTGEVRISILDAKDAAPITFKVDEIELIKNKNVDANKEINEKNNLD